MELSDQEEREQILKQLGKFAQEGENVEEEERPEEAIPDLPENSVAREFLRKAPTKGLHMPLGQEVKVMQCFRCKAFGHRSGDRECPLTQRGNFLLDSERQAREDPMSHFVATKLRERELKYERVEYLKAIVEEIRREERDKHDKKKKRKKNKEKESKHKKQKL